jgi:hypothetical protein
VNEPVAASRHGDDGDLHAARLSEPAPATVNGFAQPATYGPESDDGKAYPAHGRLG